AAMISSVLGTMAAWVLVRRHFRGKVLFEFLVVSPLYVPYIVFALGLYFVYAAVGILGMRIGIALGHAVLGLPLAVIVVSTSLRSMDPMLERAAASLGASRTRIFLEIVLPLILPGVAAGAVLAFLLSWDELLIPLFVGGTRYRTLPLLL